MARAVAARLGYRHIDTGAMYRAVAWKAMHEGIDPADAPAVAALSDRAEFQLDNGAILIDGHDVARAIRTPEIDQAAAIVARHPTVRRTLVARQQRYGEHGGVVMEGRDIGTVVFPQADVKIYLDASPEERARRRAADPAHTSQGVAPGGSRDRARRTRPQRLDASRVAALGRPRRHRHRHDRHVDRRGRGRVLRLVERQGNGKQYKVKVREAYLRLIPHSSRQSLSE